MAKTPDPAAGWKGGIGTDAVEEDGVIVAALAAVNTLGDIVEDDGTPIAANRNPDAEPDVWPGANTTLVVVATNASLSKERAQLLAQAGSVGLSTAVRPSHTMADGDTVFALATGAVKAGQPALERMAIAAVAGAVRRGVRAAEPLGGLPAVGAEDGVIDRANEDPDMRTLEEARPSRPPPARGVAWRRAEDTGGLRRRTNPDADLMFVGEAPGFHEEQAGQTVRRGRRPAPQPDAPPRYADRPRARVHQQRDPVPAARQPRPACRTSSRRASRGSTSGSS